MLIADVVRIFCADHTYVSLKLRMDATAEKIIEQASTKMNLGEDLVLCEVKSNGGTERRRRVVTMTSRRCSAVTQPGGTAQPEAENIAKRTIHGGKLRKPVYVRKYEKSPKYFDASCVSGKNNVIILYYR